MVVDEEKPIATPGDVAVHQPISFNFDRYVCFVSIAGNVLDSNATVRLEFRRDDSNRCFDTNIAVPLQFAKMKECLGKADRTVNAHSDAADIVEEDDAVVAIFVVRLAEQSANHRIEASWFVNDCRPHVVKLRAELISSCSDRELLHVGQVDTFDDDSSWFAARVRVNDTNSFHLICPVALQIRTGYHARQILSTGETMKTIKIVALVVFLSLTQFALPACRTEEMRDLFNGKDLGGWTRVNTAESTWSVKEGMLICSGKPIGELRTTRMYQNFVLEVEWRHMKPGGNAGIFVWADDITAKGVPFHRSIEVQVLDTAYGEGAGHTTHGDIFPIHGARMTPLNGRKGSRAFPTENRSRPSPEWNQYRIECNDGEISLSVNGKVVTRGKNCTPRKGYICLESEGGVVHYRNIRIKELPDTPIDPKQVAIADRGYRCLYEGIDLEDWLPLTDDWQANDWQLRYPGSKLSTLSTKERFGDVGFLFDVLVDDNFEACVFDVRRARVVIKRDGTGIKKGWNRIEGTLKGNRLTYSINTVANVEDEVETAKVGQIGIMCEHPVTFANIYVRDVE